MPYYPLPKKLHPNFSVDGVKPEANESELDYSNPLTDQLIFYTLLDSLECKDLVQGLTGTVSGTDPAIVRLDGKQGMDFGSGAGYITYGHHAHLNLTDPFTVFAEYYDDGTTSSTGYICGKVSTQWNWGLEVNNGNQKVRLRIETNGNGDYPLDSVPGGLDWMENQWNPLVFAWDGLTMYAYTLDGYLTHSITTNITGNTNPFSIGARGNGTTALQGGAVGCLGMVDRCWNFDEAMSFLHSPYQLLKPKVPMQYFVPGAAPPVGGRIMSSLAHHGGLAGMGGIAGTGGGLAG